MLPGGDSGLRCGEIIALDEQSDVDAKRGYLVVRPSDWDGHLTVPKGGRERKVMLTASRPRSSVTVTCAAIGCSGERTGSRE